jgi:hypothetical protein
MKKNMFKFVFDIGLVTLFILMDFERITGLKFLEIAGIILGFPPDSSFFIIHFPKREV